MKVTPLSRETKLVFLRDISHAVGHAQNIESFMEAAAPLIEEHLSVDAICLYLKKRDHCVLCWTRGVSREIADGPDIQEISSASAAGRRAFKRRVVTRASQGVGNPASFAGHIRKHGFWAIVWIPLFGRGRVVGVMALARKAGAPDFAKDDDLLLYTLGELLGSAVVLSTPVARLHEDIRQLEAREAYLYDDAPAMLVAVDSWGLITNCNHTLLRALSYRMRELVGHSIREILPDYAQQPWEATGDFDSAEIEDSSETTMTTKDGRRLEVRIFPRPLNDPDVGNVGAMLIFQDITEHNRIKSENLYKSLLVDNSADTMFVRRMDDWSILYANEAAWKTRYYTREEFMRLKPHEMWPESYQDNWRRLHEKFLKDGEYVVVGPQLCKEGYVKEMEIAARKLEYRGQSYAAVIMRDLTERNMLQAELERIQRVESLGRLAAGLAHDFNNMLVGIMGHASLMKANLTPKNQAYKSVEVIEETASHAAQLVSRLMVFAGADEPKLEILDLNETAEHLISLLAGLLPANITVRKVLAVGQPHIKADRAQIMQCALNLCLNARDAMPDGGRMDIKTFISTLSEPCVLSATGMPLPPGNYAGFTVRDTGIGMDQATLRRIFEPYFTTKSEAEGHGFGLSTTYGIVRRHGGHINVRSIPGVGARFTMLFPLEEAVENAKVEEQPITERATGKALVVEDDETVRDFLDVALGRAGYTVLLTEDGESAIREFKAHRAEIGVVILDLKMPGMPGEEVLRTLKEIDPSARILVSSGYSDTGKTIEGACGYLQKPYKLRELIDAVSAAMKHTSPAEGKTVE